MTAAFNDAAVALELGDAMREEEGRRRRRRRKFTGALSSSCKTVLGFGIIRMCPGEAKGRMSRESRRGAARRGARLKNENEWRSRSTHKVQ
jgi:hypothetical protein